MADEQQEGRRVPTDGSYGAGPLSELTIYTTLPEGGTKEETFTIPYLLINWGHLVSIDALHLIQGYKVIKNVRPDQMKDLGIA